MKTCPKAPEPRSSPCCQLMRGGVAAAPAGGSGCPGLGDEVDGDAGDRDGKGGEGRFVLSKRARATGRRD